MPFTTSGKLSLKKTNWRNPSWVDSNWYPLATHVSSGGSSKELARKYFSQLSVNTVKKLYNIYKVDFEMFGYSPQLYYDYARNGTEVSSIWVMKKIINYLK